MTLVDKFIRWYRVRMALKVLPRGGDLLDVGCHDGYLIAKAAPRFQRCLGIEAQTIEFNRVGKADYLIGKFPQDLPKDKRFDCITMLAVAEHFPEDVFYCLPDICAGLLMTGGRLVVTQPAIMTDHVLSVLQFFRLIDEDVHIEEHKGLNPLHLVETFQKHPDFTCAYFRKFQFGLNNLMVFQKN